MISAQKQMRGSLTSNDTEFFRISDAMTKKQPILSVTNNGRYRWKNSLPLHEKKEYDAYLQKLRQRHPNDTWRLKNNNKYHPLCKNGFIQRHCNLDQFLKETCVQTNIN